MLSEDLLSARRFAAAPLVGRGRSGFFPPCSQRLIEVNVFIIVSGAFCFSVKIFESESETRTSGPIFRRRTAAKPELCLALAPFIAFYFWMMTEP